MASPPQLRSLYRAFLREMPPRPLLAAPRSPLHVQLRQAFEPTTTTSETASSSETPSLALGEQYLAYLQAQRLYGTLLERYNPGLAADLDEQERVRLTARRVGINLPKEYKGGEGGEGKDEGR